MASGDYYTAQNTNGKTILANLIGTTDSEPMLLMTYVGSSSSVSLIGETTVSIGYVGESPRSGSRIVKAFSLGSTMAAGTITIRR